MDTVLIKSMALRVVLTPLLWFTRQSIPLTVAGLTILDIIDCNPVVLSFMKGTETYCSLNPTYEFYDKVVDLFQNIVAVILLSQHVDIPPLALFFIAYRAVGVFYHYLTKDTLSYVMFVEFIKEYLLLLWYFNGRIPHVYLIIAILAKAVYEYSMHSKHVMLTAYKTIFE
jgi:hypothetical protein